jgi:hypothetical protein
MLDEGFDVLPLQVHQLARHPSFGPELSQAFDGLEVGDLVFALLIEAAVSERTTDRCLEWSA